MQGVLITHRAVVSTVAAQIDYLSLVGPVMGGGLGPDDVMLSYLPLAHIFDRCALRCKLIFARVVRRQSAFASRRHQRHPPTGPASAAPGHRNGIHPCLCRPSCAETCLMVPPMDDRRGSNKVEPYP